MKKIKFKLLSIIALTAMALLVMANTPVTYAADDKFITVEDFAKELAKEIGLENINGGGVDALISAGVMKESDFKDYSAHLKRGDAIMLLGRADEYLFGTQIDSELVKMTIDRRISDIDC